MGNLESGSIVDGKYKILRRLAVGRIGVIYEALHIAIDRHVALKVFDPRTASSPEMVQRFLNEASTANQIRHPAVVDISGRGVLPDNSLYMAMELLTGEDLSKRMSAMGGKLPEARAVHIGWEIADVLTAAHQAGIVHRGLKPGTIMLIPDEVAVYGERVKILDFSIAKRMGSQEELTTPTRVLGFMRYMAPEQLLSSRNVDGKADVYALGVMLFQLLSGKLPPGPNATNLGELVPGLSKGLCALVHSMLIKQREGRPTMAEVADQLYGMDSLFLEQVEAAMPNRASASAPAGRDSSPAISNDQTKMLNR